MTFITKEVEEFRTDLLGGFHGKRRFCAGISAQWVEMKRPFFQYAIRCITFGKSATSAVFAFANIRHANLLLVAVIQPSTGPN